MPRLSSDDYDELARSYATEPPRRDEMFGEPQLNPRSEEPHRG
jgi:hypothetical protein